MKIKNKYLKNYQKDLFNNLEVELDTLNIYYPLFRNLGLIKKINTNKDIPLDEIHRIITENKIFLDEYEKRKNNLNKMMDNIQTITDLLNYELKGAVNNE